MAGRKVIVKPATPNPAARSSARATIGSGKASPRSPSWSFPDTIMIVAARCDTVIDALALIASTDACNDPDPFPVEVTLPVPSTVKTSSFELDQVTVTAIAAPYWSRTVALKVATWLM